MTRVLVVEDERIVAIDIARMLAKLGYDVAGMAKTGTEAVQKAGDERPDLVLMDIQLPGVLDGIAAANAIRAQFRVPVVYVTAFFDADTLARAKTAGPCGYIVKPFKESDLAATIEVALHLDAVDRRLRDREQEVRRLNEALERRVAERTAQLEAANRELESFCYSVAHDLRAPLRGIDGFSHAVLDTEGAALSAGGRRDLERVRAAAQRMGHLIDGLLDLSRIARAELRHEPVDCSALAHEIAAELRRADPQRYVELRIEPGLRASGDVTLLRIVLENLLGNAWKFTSQRPDAVIELFRPEPADLATFAVRDNGVGFDMAYADKLFGAFQRLHDADEFAGAGIGLATVQRIVGRHGGRVWAEATPGGGATFYVALP